MLSASVQTVFINLHHELETNYDSFTQMIDPEQDRTIRFSADDVPELTEIPSADRKAEREAQRRRKASTLRWLQHHAGFRPFGVEW